MKAIGIAATVVVLASIVSFQLFAQGYSVIGVISTPAGLQHRVPQDYSTIQAAIDASHDGDTVLVAEGTYKENIRYRGKAIVVGSRFLLDGDTTLIAKTIIDGSGSTKADSASVVYFIEGEDTTSVLTGFTIRGGSGTVFPLLTPPIGNYGGGIYCDNAGASILHNIVEKNRLEGDLCMGAGIYVVGSGSSYPFLIVEDNRVRDNSVRSTSTNVWAGAGGLGIWGVEARVVDNIVERDTAIGAGGAFGGGIAFGAWATTGHYPGGYFARNVIRSNVVSVPAQAVAVGAGMVIQWTGQVTIQENLIEDNRCSSGSSGYAQGGGMAILDQNITGYGLKMLLNNRFIGNSLSSPFWSDGAGLLLFCTMATVSGNEFTDNSAAGFQSGGGGGVSIQASSFRIENNIFTHNNSRVDGGALWITEAPQSGKEQLIVNNTIVDNHAVSYGAGMKVDNAEGLVTLNTIFWADTAGRGGEIDGAGTYTVQYCDVQGGRTGTGNIDADPLFIVGDTVFNLAITPKKSPCIGYGADSIQVNGIWYKAPTCDYDGHARHMPVGPQPSDIGAQEEQVSTDVQEAHPGIPKEFVLEQNYPNPFNPSTRIKYTVGVAGGKGQVASVKLVVYDLLGREVEVLVNERKAPGTYEVSFDGSGLSSGVYFYRLQAGTFTDTKKFLLVR